MRSGVFITCSLLLLSGCAHGNWQQSVARSASQVGNRSASVGPVKPESREWLINDAPEPRSPVTLLRAQNQDSPGVALTSSSAGKTPVISHDAVTLALIDKETRDFSPADRDRAVAALKAIPSESVPAVLQLWKAGLISPLAHPNSPVILAPATAADLPAPATLASYEESPVDPGLGQKSPWQNQAVRHADYARDWNEQPGLGNRVVQASQIARVTKPAVGYSSPFPETPDLAEPGSGSENSEYTAAGSSTGSKVVAHWFSDDLRSTPQPVIPADWSSASGHGSITQGADDGRLNSFSGDSGRRVVMPSDWQGNAQQSPLPQFTRANSIPIPQPLAAAATATLDGPVIRPQPRSLDQELATSSPPAIQRMGYSEAVPEGNSQELSLVPGQLLPGFEHLAATSPQRTPAATQPRSAPPATTIQHVADQPELQPPAPRRQSSSDALQYLIQATEAEVTQLAPGQSADELQYYIERQVYLRLLYLMSGQAESALRPIPHVPAADQEFWTQVLWGVNNYFDLPRIPNHSERAAQTISQFNTAMLRLKERAPLDLKHATFCHKIDGYGEYETYAKDEFTPGQRVLVYAEIDNFHSELSTEGIYRTRLKSTLQVVSAEAPQEPVDVKVYPVTEDFCRNHRRDYFHSYVVEIPVRCVRGSHALKLIIEDELSGKTATCSVPFVVR